MGLIDDVVRAELSRRRGRRPRSARRIHVPDGMKAGVPGRPASPRERLSEVWPSGVSAETFVRGLAVRRLRRNACPMSGDDPRSAEWGLSAAPSILDRGWIWGGMDHRHNWLRSSCGFRDTCARRAPARHSGLGATERSSILNCAICVDPMRSMRARGAPMPEPCVSNTSLALTYVRWQANCTPERPCGNSRYSSLC